MMLLYVQATPVHKEPSKFTLTTQQLRDKIMGGWAGQVMAAAYHDAGGLRFNRSMAGNHSTAWHDDPANETFAKADLYTDICMEVAFTGIFDKEGLDAPAQSYAKAYAEAGNALWHANQTARYNILHGIGPPASGHWLNNPHADDTDFQSLADFAGLMCPGMPQAAALICDKVGHIMNYGDGYYGGLYIATMYSLAFTHTTAGEIVRESVKCMPHRSMIFQCIDDVVRWHRQYPNDWKPTWLAIQKKWSDHTPCPQGALNAFTTDARLNAAYITLALLYGGGDFTKTLEIAAKTGCKSGNASVGGILGALSGYSNIPAHYRQRLDSLESIDIVHSDLSLKDAYNAGFNQALKMIDANGGRVRANQVTIMVQRPIEAKWERSFEGHFAVERRWMENKLVDDQLEFSFEGIGFVLRGEAAPWNSNSSHVFLAELYLNNKFVERVEWPASFIARRPELFWKYQLPHNKYQVKIKILNPVKEYRVRVSDVVVYDVLNR